MTETTGIQKRKKPSFIRHDAHKKPRVGTRWNKPKGRQNKMRLNKKGYRRGVSIGFGSDKRIRDLVKGLMPVRVHTITELLEVNKEKEGAVIAKNVGQKNKLELVKKAKESGINVLNVRDIDAYITKTEEQFKKKTEKKKETEKQKEEKKKELEKKAKEAEEKKEEKTEDDKKEEEKKKKQEIMKKGQ